MADVFVSVFSKMWEIYSKQIPVMIALAIGFTLLAIFESQKSSPGKAWWRNPGLITDLTYGLVHAGIGQYFKIPAMIAVMMILMGIMKEDEINACFKEGRGPLSQVPFYWQVAFYMIAGDFLLYWIHRIFHGATMWRFHAPHHSATEVDWTTTYRFHPVNLALGPAAVSILMFTLGIKPGVMAFTLPFDIVSAAFVHANVNWTLGPLKYVIATPVFHRWHHTHTDEGGNMNFAPTFSLWDYLFGTFYMPEGKLPAVFGIDDGPYPEGYLAQLAEPFKPHPAPAAGPAAIVPAE